MIMLKRVYASPSKDDGTRVLVDRLWPRGLTKQKAAVNVWLKDVAPSAGLRKWFGHKPERWEEFKKRYWAELRANKYAIAKLYDIFGKKNVTLLFGAKDERFNDAVALKEFIESHRRPAA